MHLASVWNHYFSVGFLKQTKAAFLWYSTSPQIYSPWSWFSPEMVWPGARVQRKAGLFSIWNSRGISFSRSSRITSIWPLGLHHPFWVKEPETGCTSWGISSLVPLASKSQIVNDFTILKRIVMWISLGNKEERESHFPPVGSLGTVIPVLYSLLYFFTSFFFLCWVSSEPSLYLAVTFQGLSQS